MSTGSAFAGSLWNLVRFVFLLLLVALVLLFIIAKGGKKEDREGESGETEDSKVAQFEVIEGEFGKGWTDLKYRVKYRWSGGKLKYELFIHPYEPRIEQLRKSGMELVLLSFVDENRVRVIPRKVPARIEMRDLEPVLVEEEGLKYYKGWIFEAEFAKEEVSSEKIADTEMGWLFSDDLLSLLRNLRRERLVREAKERSRSEAGGPPVSAR